MNHLSFCLVILLIGATIGKSAKNFFWFPIDNGDGVAPAFIDTPHSLRAIEPTADPANIRFYLHTHNNKDTRQEIENTTESIEASYFDRNAPVLFFAHGFSSSSTGGSASEIKAGFIDKGYPTNINLILVDWSRLAAAPWYDVAAQGTRLVGHKSAYLLNFLVQNGYTTVDKLRFGGHSLGAHVAGFAGADFRGLSGSLIPRIDAFDPALPRFGAADDEGRIDKTDAAFVTVIHTASGTLAEGELAFIEPRGHADFYPNKGRNQPGCLEIAGECSHSRCYKYFSESIQYDQFRACKCADNAWDPDGNDKFTSCSCANYGQAYMGESTPSNTRGIFYLTTNNRSPFAQG